MAQPHHPVHVSLCGIELKQGSGRGKMEGKAEERGGGGKAELRREGEREKERRERRVGGVSRKREALHPSVLPRKQPRPAVSVPVDRATPVATERNGAERSAFLFPARSHPRRPCLSLLCPALLLYITPLLSLARHYGHGHARTHLPLPLFLSLLTKATAAARHKETYGRGYEDEARRLLLLPRGGGAGGRCPRGAPPEAAPDDARGLGGRRRRRVRWPRRHVRGAARRSGGVHTRRRRGVRGLAGRPRRRHAHVQEIQRARAEQGGAVEGVAAVPRRAGEGVVRRRAPVPAALRGRRQPRSLLPPRHDPVLLPGQPRVRGGADGCGGGGRPPRRALLAGRDPVQRQRREQGRPRPPRGRRAVRARGVAGPRGRAPRAGPLPAGRLRRAALRGGRAAPPHPGQRARARRRGHRLGVLDAAPRRQRQGLLSAAARVPAQRLRVPRRRRRDGRGGGARGQPVPGGLVRGAPAGRSGGRSRRDGVAGGGGGGRWSASVLAGAVRAARDAAARVPAVLGVRRGELLLPGLPGAALEDGAQGGVHAHGPVARRGGGRRRRGRSSSSGGGGAVTPRKAFRFSFLSPSDSSFFFSFFSFDEKNERQQVLFYSSLSAVSALLCGEATTLLLFLVSFSSPRRWVCTWQKQFERRLLFLSPLARATHP